MSDYHIYGIGAALVDTEVEVSDQDLSTLSIDKGLMTLVDYDRQTELLNHFADHLKGSARASGGSAANTIIAAGYFGAKTFYSCKVANDDDGLFYLSDLEAAGVDYHRELEPVSGMTGKCLVMITPDAERTMNTYLGISETLSTHELHEGAAAGSDYVYLEGYLVTSPTGRAAAIRLREIAQANGRKVALSLSDPAMVEFFNDGLKEMIGDGVDLLFCNEAEAKGFVAAESLEAAIPALRKFAKTLAITRGAEGALLIDGDTQVSVDAFAVEAIDTNGAGDMFAGAVLFGLSQGWSLEQTGKLASRASAQVVSQFGPRLRPEQHQQLLSEISGN